MKRAWLCGLLLLGASGCEEVTGPSGYLATFEDAAGLRAGAPVYVAGVKVGRIKTVNLVEGKAEVELLVDSMHDVEVTEASCVSLGRYAFDSETHLKLEPNKGGKPLDRGGRFTCVQEVDALGERVDRLTEAAAKLLETALDGKGTVARLLEDEALAERVVAYFEAGPPKATPAEPVKDAEPEGDSEDGQEQPPPQAERRDAAPQPPAAENPGDLKDPFVNPKPRPKPRGETPGF